MTKSLTKNRTVERHFDLRHVFEIVMVVLIIALATISLWPNFSGHTTESLDQNKLKYDGYVVNQRFNGQGTLRFANQDQYTGTFANGRFSGKGHYVSHDGWEFQGSFANGKMTGTGTITQNNQIIATFKNGELQGQ